MTSGNDFLVVNALNRATVSRLKVAEFKNGPKNLHLGISLPFAVFKINLTVFEPESSVTTAKSLL